MKATGLDPNGAADPRSEFYIDTAGQLREFCDRAFEHERLAVDTEANSLYNYFEKVCLIQLCAGGDNVLVDPLAELNLDGLFRLMRRKRLVFHGADFDLRLLYAQYQFTPRQGVFDTSLAARLLGHERFSLASLVERYFSVQLAKYGQKSNWAQRPLTPEQITYARDDTRYLLPLADVLAEELEAQGRLAWHTEWCSRLVQSATAASSGAKHEKDAWRIKGLAGTTRRELAYVKQIWNWREKSAAAADIPPFKVLGNRQLIELAKWAARYPGRDLADGPRLPRSCRNGRYRKLVAAIRRANDTPSNKLPPLKPRTPRANPSNGDIKPRVAAVKRACDAVARELGVEPSVLASKAQITSIVRVDAKDIDSMIAASGLMRWQAKTIESAVSAALGE